MKQRFTIDVPAAADEGCCLSEKTQVAILEVARVMQPTCGCGWRGDCTTEESDARAQIAFHLEMERATVSP